MDSFTCRDPVFGKPQNKYYLNFPEVRVRLESGGVALVNRLIRGEISESMLKQFEHREQMEALRDGPGSRQPFSGSQQARRAFVVHLRHKRKRGTSTQLSHLDEAKS